MAVSDLKGAYIVRCPCVTKPGSLIKLYIDSVDGPTEIPLAKDECLATFTPFRSITSVLKADTDGYKTTVTLRVLGRYEFENRSEMNEWLAAKAKGQVVDRLEKRRTN